MDGDNLRMNYCKTDVGERREQVINWVRAWNGSEETGRNKRGKILNEKLETNQGKDF